MLKRTKNKIPNHGADLLSTERFFSCWFFPLQEVVSSFRQGKLHQLFHRAKLTPTGHPQYLRHGELVSKPCLRAEPKKGKRKEPSGASQPFFLTMDDINMASSSPQTPLPQSEMMHGTMLELPFIPLACREGLVKQMPPTWQNAFQGGPALLTFFLITEIQGEISRGQSRPCCAYSLLRFPAWVVCHQPSACFMPLRRRLT